MTDEGQLCSACKRSLAQGHRPECKYVTELERWFMETVGLQIQERGGLERWLDAINEDQ